jgi:hypothetical protein
MGKWYRTIDDSIGAGADEESLFTSGWRVGRQTTNFVKLLREYFFGQRAKEQGVELHCKH